MKIGILTHHYINNFGAFLQGYALRETVVKLFPNDEVYVANYINYKHFIINTCGWFRFYKDKENLAIWLEKIQLPNTFSQERKKYLKLTKKCKNVHDLNRLNLDCIIVGSDEVWNYRDKKGNAFVKFGIGVVTKRLIAYAPSVGHTTGEDVPDYVVNGIKNFHAVSARDDLTEKLAEKIRNEKIMRVTDPVFLTYLPDEVVYGIKKPYILFYYCDGLVKDEKEKIFMYAKNHNLNVYGAGETDKRYCKITVNLTPFQWIWMFRNAEYVLTGTFHGVVFSLLNHRQFASYLTDPSRVQKVSSLLKEFGLETQQCNGMAGELISTMQRKIPYDQIQPIFDKRKNESLQYLKQSIEGDKKIGE